MLPEKQLKTYNDFFASASGNDILEPKTTLLVQLGVAMSLGCYP